MTNKYISLSTNDLLFVLFQKSAETQSNIEDDERFTQEAHKECWRHGSMYLKVQKLRRMRTRNTRVIMELIEVMLLIFEDHHCNEQN